MTIKKTIAKIDAKKVIAKQPAKKVVASKATKPAAKPLAKKAVAKAAATKKSLVYAPDQQSFWVKNGQVLNSLVALRDALDEMEKEVYTYHAGTAHNDFAKWVSDVLSDSSCATELGKAKTPKTAKTVVVKHLKFYAI